MRGLQHFGQIMTVNSVCTRLELPRLAQPSRTGSRAHLLQALQKSHANFTCRRYARSPRANIRTILLRYLLLSVLYPTDKRLTTALIPRNTTLNQRADASMSSEQPSNHSNTSNNHPTKRQDRSRHGPILRHPIDGFHPVVDVDRLATVCGDAGVLAIPVDADVAEAAEVL